MLNHWNTVNILSTQRPAIARVRVIVSGRVIVYPVVKLFNLPSDTIR